MKKTASKQARKAAKTRPLSRRTRPFGESVIREMTRIGAEVGGVNLAQGLPDFDPPQQLLDALPGILARARNHQYSYTWGSLELRQAVAEKCARFNGMTVDPRDEVTITCGVSEALVDAVLALTEPGDEVVMLEPWYENYLPACVLAGVRPRFLPLREKDYALDLERLAGALTSRTRLLLLNTPGNPSGRVLSREELAEIARLCRRFGVIAVVDVMVDTKALGWKDDWDFVNFLARKVGVLAVPGSSFYTRRGGGKTRARLNFAKKEETLVEAARRLLANDLALARKPRPRPSGSAS